LRADVSARHYAQDIRIDFQFSKGAFDFSFLPFTIPYPVPFKALGDETKVQQVERHHPVRVVGFVCGGIHVWDRGMQIAGASLDIATLNGLLAGLH
jgi:hypothetical protein